MSGYGNDKDHNYGRDDNNTTRTGSTGGGMMDKMKNMVGLGGDSSTTGTGRDNTYGDNTTSTRDNTYGDTTTSRDNTYGDTTSSTDNTYGSTTSSTTRGDNYNDSSLGGAAQTLRGSSGITSDLAHQPVGATKNFDPFANKDYDGSRTVEEFTGGAGVTGTTGLGSSTRTGGGTYGSSTGTGLGSSMRSGDDSYGSSTTRSGTDTYGSSGTTGGILGSTGSRRDDDSYGSSGRTGLDSQTQGSSTGNKDNVFGPTGSHRHDDSYGSSGRTDNTTGTTGTGTYGSTGSNTYGSTGGSGMTDPNSTGDPGFIKRVQDAVFNKNDDKYGKDDAYGTKGTGEGNDRRNDL